MVANTNPIYSIAPAVNSAKIAVGGAVVGPSANTALDGSGANTYIVFVAGTNGSYLQRIRAKAIGSPNATVMRVFLCSAITTAAAFVAGTTNTAANTTLVDELTLPGVTASTTAATPTFEIPLGFAIPPGWGVLVTFGASTGSAGTGYDPVVIGGNY